MARYYAGILGGMAFATVILQGILQGTAGNDTLKMAIASLLAFAAWGFVVGQIAASTVKRDVEVQVYEKLQARKQEAKGDA